MKFTLSGLFLIAVALSSAAGKKRSIYYLYIISSQEPTNWCTYSLKRLRLRFRWFQLRYELHWMPRFDLLGFMQPPWLGRKYCQHTGPLYLLWGRWGLVLDKEKERVSSSWLRLGWMWGVLRKTKRWCVLWPGQQECLWAIIDHSKGECIYQYVWNQMLLLSSVESLDVSNKYT